MEILAKISSSTKYFYIVLIVILLIVIIAILKKLATIDSDVKYINKDITRINRDLNQLKEKETIIDNTVKNSLPFFIKVFLGLAIIREIAKDYFETKPEKRSLKKSVKKTAKYRLRKIA